MLGPRLIPEITISGSASRSPVTARCTQSVGVPLTKRKPFGAVRTVNGRSRVSEFDAPLRSRSGATTVRSACGGDAKEKIDAGATLVQLYTGLIYRGPGLVAECAQALATP